MILGNNTNDPGAADVAVWQFVESQDEPFAMWVTSEFRIEGYAEAFDADIDAHLAAVSYARTSNESNEEYIFEMRIWDINQNSLLKIIDCHHGVFCLSLHAKSETLFMGKVDRPLLEVGQLHRWQTARSGETKVPIQNYCFVDLADTPFFYKNT